MKSAVRHNHAPSAIVAPSLKSAMRHNHAPSEREGERERERESFSPQTKPSDAPRWESTCDAENMLLVVRPLRLHLSGTPVRACRKVAVPRPPALSPHHTHVECTLWECGNSRAWRGSKPSVTRLFTPAGKRVRQAAPLPGHWRRAGAKSKVGSPQFVVFAIVESTSQPLHAPEASE